MSAVKKSLGCCTIDEHTGSDDMTDSKKPKQTRIQKRNIALILEAALEVFSRFGFRGATLDQIAEAAGLSKPNLLYYFKGKDDIHQRLLSDLLTTWLDPLRDIDPTGDPINEMKRYVRRKLQMSQDYPRESRLFANEILNGAPRLEPFISGDLKALVEEKSALLNEWMAAGHIARCDPHHLLFSVWSLTQHYADFATQIELLLGKDQDPFPQAEAFLDHLFVRVLTPGD